MKKTKSLSRMKFYHDKIFLNYVVYRFKNWVNLNSSLLSFQRCPKNSFVLPKILTISLLTKSGKSLFSALVFKKICNKYINYNVHMVMFNYYWFFLYLKFVKKKNIVFAKLLMEYFPIIGIHILFVLMIIFKYFII